jgi:hypothetical protein
VAVYLFTYHAYRSWNADHRRGYTNKDEGVLPPDVQMADFDDRNAELPPVESVIRTSARREGGEACRAEAIFVARFEPLKRGGAEANIVAPAAHAVARERGGAAGASLFCSAAAAAADARGASGFGRFVGAVATTVAAARAACGKEVAGDGAVLIEQWKQFAAAGTAVPARDSLLCHEALSAKSKHPERHLGVWYPLVRANRDWPPQAEGDSD